MSLHRIDPRNLKIGGGNLGALHMQRAQAPVNIGWTSLLDTSSVKPGVGLVRVFWKRVDGDWHTGSIPRVRIQWSSVIPNVGQVNDYQMIFDAMYGTWCLNCTSCRVDIGWPEDSTNTPGGTHTIEGTLYDLPGGADAQSYATYTQPVVISAGPAPVTVPVPPGTEAMAWFDAGATDVEIFGRDPSGATISRNQTGPAGATIPTSLYAVAPEVAGGSATITTHGGAVPRGRLVFYFSGQTPQ